MLSTSLMRAHTHTILTELKPGLTCLLSPLTSHGRDVSGGCLFPLENLVAALATSSSTRRQKSLQMDRLRRTLSFHSEKKAKATSNAQPSASTVKQKPLQWQEDEKAVRLGTCSFTVKVRTHAFAIYRSMTPNDTLSVSWKCRST